MRENDIVQVIRTRAQRYLAAPRLEVDYYRIRRKLAFPWPLASLPEVSFAVALANYPWHIWLAWGIEERIAAIGWAGEIDADDKLRAQSRAELLSLARWPAHSSKPTPELVLGHFLRILVLAARSWSWLGDEVQGEVTAACNRALEQRRQWLDEELPKIQTVEQVISTPPPARDRITQNIPLIGTIALALAADRANHASAAALRQRVTAILTARLNLLDDGMTEAVAYDGYVLDFAADWISMLPASEREALIDHPGLTRTLAMGIELAAPGDVVNVAHLSDVKPKEMPFHVSAHAKLSRIRPMPGSVWYLRNARLDWLRTEALAAMQCLADDAAVAAPSATAATVGPYAVTLRSGWDADDVAVVVAAGRSPMSHIHHDAGSIMIGHRGQWLIADPGYQQYLKKREREFTIGPRAHNCPVINGVAQSIKAGKVLDAASAGDAQRVIVDLTACYAPEANVRRARRTVWLLPAKTVVVCDEIDAAAVDKVEYSWHGLPAACWWVENGRAVVHHDGVNLWIACDRAAISHSQIDRQPGSRGHLTLAATISNTGNQSICWWVFNLAAAPVEFKTDGATLKLKGRELHPSD